MKISSTESGNHPDSSGISSVGAWLKSAREERGVTLDTVAQVTRIGKNYLDAIEAGDLSRLPSQAYTRGFIRLYAAHLGLSPDTALSFLESSPVNCPEAAPEIPAAPGDVRSPLRGNGRRLIIITTLAVALTTGYLLLKPARQSSTPTQRSRVDTPPAEQALPTATTRQEPGTQPANGPSPAPLPRQKTGESQGIILRLKAVSDGRIHITIDGSVSQEYDLVSGDLVEWKAEDSFVLDLDNAASVEGELDGKKLNPFGEQGRAAHLVLKADGTHKE